MEKILAAPALDELQGFAKVENDKKSFLRIRSGIYSIFSLSVRSSVPKCDIGAADKGAADKFYT